jgi:uncharacterized protein YyaL (SSP411 family)
MNTKEKCKILSQKANKFIIQQGTKNKIGIVQSQSFNPVKKKWIKKLADFDDTGDYFCYLYWYAKVFKDKKTMQFIDDQFNIWVSKFQTKKGFFYTPFDPDKKISFRSRNIISLYDHQDGLLGLLEMFSLTNDEKYLKQAMKLGDSLSLYVKKYNGLIAHTVIPSLNMINPATLAFSEVGGLFMENYCHLYLSTKNKKYLDYAQIIANFWINTREFKKTGLFMRAYHPWFKFVTRYFRWHYTKPMKDNTNLLFGLIQLYKITGDDKFRKSILHFFDNVYKLKDKDQEAYCFWYDFKKDEISDSSLVLTQNHPVIDVFIEAYIVLNDKKYLDKAIGCTDFWLSKKNKKTGLIPEIIKSGKIINPNTRIDSFIDLHTICLKLYDITKDKKYLDESKSALDALFKYFVSEDNWWFESVDSTTGKGISNLNEIKFVGLPIRFYMLLNHILNGEGIYNNKEIYYLIRDR